MNPPKQIAQSPGKGRLIDVFCGVRRGGEEAIVQQFYQQVDVDAVHLQRDEVRGEACGKG